MYSVHVLFKRKLIMIIDLLRCSHVLWLRVYELQNSVQNFYFHSHNDLKPPVINLTKQQVHAS